MKYYAMELEALLIISLWTNNKKSTCTCKTQYLLYVSIYLHRVLGGRHHSNETTTFKSKVSKLKLFMTCFVLRSKCR